MGIPGYTETTVDNADIGYDWCLMSAVMNMDLTGNATLVETKYDHDMRLAMAETIISDNFFYSFDFV